MSVPHVIHFFKNKLFEPELIYPEKSHCVYFLQSTIGNKTYVGYSNNPFNRLRQHNGIITGGAKRTRMGRPWKIVCVVSGFPDKNSALMFEWKWHDIRARRKRTKNDHRGNRQYRKCLGIADCKSGLEYLFKCQWTSNSPKPHSFNLSLFWNMEGENLFSKNIMFTYRTTEIFSHWIVHIGELTNF